MRENRTSGSEGGEGFLPDPYRQGNWWSHRPAASFADSSGGDSLLSKLIPTAAIVLITRCRHPGERRDPS